MNRIVSFICIIVMLFSLCPSISNAENFGATFTADEKIVTAGNMVDYKLSLDLNDDTSIGGMGFNLNFDSSAFYIDSVTLDNNFLTADISINNNYGWVTFRWESDSAINSSIDVFTVHLIAFSDATITTYNPSLSNLEIFDDTVDMNDILALTENLGSITVTDTRVLTGIAINTQPLKKTYMIGSEFDIEGLSIIRNYSDNSSDIMNEGFVSIYDFSSEGIKEVVVFYDGYRTSPIIVTVIPVFPTVITSSIYSVSSGYIGKIAKGTTVSDLVNSLNEKNYIETYKDNIKAISTDIVSTGMTIKLVTNGSVTNSYTAIVTGDVNGDGEINIIDLVMVKAFILNIKILSTAADKAADTDGDKCVSITDLGQIKSFLLGKSLIIPQNVD